VWQKNNLKYAKLFTATMHWNCDFSVLLINLLVISCDCLLFDDDAQETRASCFHPVVQFMISHRVWLLLLV